MLDSILTVGQAAGVPGRARRLVSGLRDRLAAVAARVGHQPRPKVAVIEWVDPPFTAGHLVPDLVTAAGGTPVAARPGKPSVFASWSEIGWLGFVPDGWSAEVVRLTGTPDRHTE